MDITLLYFFGLFIISLLYMAYKFKAPYLSVLSGVLLIFIGIFMSVDGTITQTFCDYNANTSAIECVNATLPAFSFWHDFGIAIGAMLMFLGAAVILDIYLRSKGED